MEHLRAAGAWEQTIREQEEIQKEATLGCAGKAMEAAGISPHEVHFVLTACTISNPWPSMADLIMHDFDMRSDCQN
ncbi:hypothetical protein WJX75_004732 [Coccomyxa subellipsoidea]|uniref:FAE domain-containing protein n=1 Tax=Coccomyxa subellipsoidea TaxID=248742 RepID=A0ABR2YAA1_9CHLO